MTDLFTIYKDFVVLVAPALFTTAPFWMPPVLLIALYALWMRYQHFNTIANKNWILLEVRLPKEIFKSPAAMEVILAGAFYHEDESTWYAQLVKGDVRTPFSLEIVSIEGSVHFLIRTDRLFKETIEAQIYANYPGVEIFEVDDYVHTVPYSVDADNPWEMWGSQLALTKPDPYPIKTYVDYGLDDAAMKEEHKTDPMTTVLEYLGSLGPGEHAWMQIIIRGTMKTEHTPGTIFGETTWQEEGKHLIEKLMGRHGHGGEHGAEGADLGSLKLSPGEREVVEAIERSISKIGFDTGIRFMYMAKKGIYAKHRRWPILNLFRAFETKNLNSFKSSHATYIKYPWQDFKGIILRKKKLELFEAYCARGYFYYPFKMHYFVLNTEELATLFHFPGGVVTTPMVSRIESKKSEPPANLPV